MQKVQNLVAENQHPSARGFKEAGERLRARGSALRRFAQGGHTVDARQLRSQIEPRRFAAWLRIPCVPNEGCDLRARALLKARFIQQAAYTVVVRGALARAREVVQGGQRMRLTAAELGN